MFIVLDGIDGAGKGRQRNEINQYLQKKLGNIETMEFPNHKSVVYEGIIHPALHEEIELEPMTWFLSFVLDQSLQYPIIRKAVNSKSDFFTADGYFTTTIAYQAYLSRTVTLDYALDFVKQTNMPVPDIAIFIDVDPKIAMSRKQIEDGHDEGMDIFERSIQKQNTLREAFKDMVKNNIFCKWVIVDGNGSIPEVTQNIINVLENNKII